MEMNDHMTLAKRVVSDADLFFKKKSNGTTDGQEDIFKWFIINLEEISAKVFNGQMTTIIS